MKFKGIDDKSMLQARSDGRRQMAFHLLCTIVNFCR